ncbi:MAG: hypothetical protein WC565_09130 [Parcubacteria group bacterium]
MTISEMPRTRGETIAATYCRDTPPTIAMMIERSREKPHRRNPDKMIIPMDEIDMNHRALTTDFNTPTSSSGAVVLTLFSRTKGVAETDALVPILVCRVLW